ncbi:hypothetical protein ABZ770_37110 [Streptomyces sp. NPDC006654]|uniref:hypothetical protein n=1 Tax=Streptomyces sp. NPDC006654 TaxID=3156897 RepID=UPI0033D1B3FA
MSLGDEPGYPETGHTRTRLPDDPYGGASRRGGRSSSRSLVTVVGVVVLLIAAIAFANRGDGDNNDSSSTTTTNGGANGSQSTTSPTSATGTKPVETKTNGIPSGFAHTQQGAESAAANYAVTLGSTGMFNTDSRHKIVNGLYTSAAAGKLQTAMDTAYSASFLSKLGLDANGNAPKGSTFVSRTVPVGTTAEQYADSNAKVSVWYVGLIGMSGTSSTNPVTTTWKTWTFDLQWADGDWKISADTQKDGPAPVPGDDQAAASDQISKAVEQYGGFTYAR